MATSLPLADDFLRVCRAPGYGLTVAISSLRGSLRHRRDEARKQDDAPRVYAYGLLYDTLGWTPLDKIPLSAIHVLAQGVRDAEKAASSLDVIRIRHALVEAGLLVTPTVQESDR